jgi:glycerol uptake facilitator-like aquaporin
MDDKNNIAATLAIGALFGFLAVICFLCFGKVAPENKDFFNMSLVALIGLVGTAFGYYLGTSLSSARKDVIMARKDAIIAQGAQPPALPAKEEETTS